MPEGGPAFARRRTARASAGRHFIVSVTDDRGRRLRSPGLAAWLRRVAPARAKGTVNVAVVSDARVRALNRTYRKKNYSTDVLSFPAFARPRATRPSARRADFPSPKSPAPSRFLGDIVIARGVARRQAREAGHAETVELRILALHGLLHLLGYDHERDNGRMSRLEHRL